MQNASKLSINLLGTMEVQLGGKAVAGFRQKSKWLLAVLVLRRGREIEYEALGRMLWQEPLDNKQLIMRVRQCVSNLYTLLGDDRFTKSSRSEIGIDLTQVYVDVFDFDAAATNRDLASLRQVVRLYTGDLLEGCSEDWIQTGREIRQQAYQEALELLIEHAQAGGDFITAEKYLRLAIAADRFKEANRCSLMRLLMRRGEYNSALDVYDQYRELRHDPRRSTGTEMHRLWETIKNKMAPEKGRTSALANSSDMPPIYRVPQPLRALVGREEAASTVASLFTFGRLVTLKGPPGIGKTQLALQVAAQLSTDYPDGAAFLDLTEQKKPIDIWRALTATLQIRDQPHRSVEETVCDYLAARQMLLVLDNCEHLIHSGVGVLREILLGCPYIRLLTTSRIAWGVLPGERLYTVTPLALPGAAILKRLPADPLPELRAFSAIRLFLDRVSEIHAAFELTPHDARLVAQICHLLDGVPLAILLAAGWVQTLSLQQILEHLSEGIDLLRDTRQSMPGRQGRLLLMLEVSYQLLPSSLQTLFKYLAVFHGGWNLKAAEEICQMPRVLDGLRQLQECSLVEGEREGAEVRFRLLGILQQFGAQLLAKSVEANALQNRHLDFFLSVVETAEAQLVGPNQEVALLRLDREYENFTRALEWAFTGLETEKGLRLASALWRFWHVRGHYQDGLFWLERFLLQAPIVAGSVRSKALNGAGNLASLSHDYRRARAWFQERLEFEQVRGNPHALAGALGSLANVTSELGEYEQARTLFERSLTYFRDLDDQRGVVMTLGNLAVVSWKEGRLPEACIFHEECVAFFRAAGDRNNLAVALNNCADIRLTLQEFSLVAALLRESLEIGYALQSRHTLLHSLTLIFFLLTRCDLLEQAAVLSGAMDAFLERVQLTLPVEVLEEYQRNAEQVRTALNEEAFRNARTQGSLMTLEEMIDYARISIPVDLLT